VLPESEDEGAFYRRWFEASLPAIEANQAAAARALMTCAPGTAFVDAVYSPNETVLLRQARLRGHPALNGRGMLIMQAAESFVTRMTRRHLIAAGHDPDALYDRVAATMEAAF
jgi:shikimate 5-dehydrogenase